MERIDLHTHTFASDGALLPAELVRRAATLDHAAICIADHAGPSNIDDVIDRAVKAADRLNDRQPVEVIPGIELTHLPPALIAEHAAQAVDAGAEIVVVHGETIVEPVEQGTNEAAVNAENVDILAHPGLISQSTAELAAETGTVLEISARRGHCLTNGHVAECATAAGADLVVNTDAHTPSDLVDYDQAERIARGAGLDDRAVESALRTTPRRLLEERR